MAEPSSTPLGVVRFGVFELDLQSGELRKAGVRIGLQEQPLQVLALLLERPGDVVTREQLRQRLWPGGTFVDFDHGLNAVINRLRDTLGDSAETPRFIETLPRRGYRFVGAVNPNSSEPQAEIGATNRPIAGLSQRTVVALASVALVLLSVCAGGAWLLLRRPAADGPRPRIVPLTRLAGQEDWPTFAPDGEQVAFAWSGEKYDNTDIYVTLVGSTDVRRLTTDPAEDYAPSWSPDGRRIAFLRRVGNEARIHVTSALGGPDLKVSDFPVGAALIPALIALPMTWSPDGRFIVAGRDPRSEPSTPAGMYLIPVEGGELRAITRPTRPTFDFSPIFAPDGRRLAYASCDTPGLAFPLLLPGLCALRVVDIDETFAPTSAPRTLTQPVTPAGLAWSRDGKSIMFIGAGAGSVLSRLWVDGNRPPERIEIAGSAEHPATVASRDRLVFSRFDWDNHLYRFKAGLPAERVVASSSSEWDPHFSPDGRSLVFTSDRSGKIAIWVAAADGTAPRQLTPNGWGWQGSPHWSPDGRVIAFDSQEADGHFHVWTIDAEGGLPVRITKDAGDQTTPTWSRDGRWIYFSDHRESGREIWRIPAAGGAPEQVTRTGSGFVAYESADGASLLYQPKNGDSALLVMPLTGGGEPRTLVDCVRNAAFAIVGSVVFYAGCDPGLNPSLHAIDMVRGRDRVLGRLEHFPRDASHVNFAVSPDGKTVLFRGWVRQGGDLMLIENFR
jgi:Tol biopolymer transport system component/DNA-binding winged helix-turn-helix (wHTH) protein